MQETEAYVKWLSTLTLEERNREISNLNFKLKALNRHDDLTKINEFELMNKVSFKTRNGVEYRGVVTKIKVKNLEVRVEEYRYSKTSPWLPMSSRSGNYYSVAASLCEVVSDE